MSNEYSEMKGAEQEGKSYNSNVGMAVVFILVGGVLLLSNLTGFTFDNWWALFMLIPVGSMAMGVWGDYQKNGRLTSSSTGNIIGGLSILLAASVFLFGLDWGAIWPIGIVFAGIAILLSGRSK